MRARVRPQGTRRRCSSSRLRWSHGSMVVPAPRFHHTTTSSMALWWNEGGLGGLHLCPSRMPPLSRCAPVPTPVGTDHAFPRARQVSAPSPSTPGPCLPWINIMYVNVVINYRNHLRGLSSNQTFTQRGVGKLGGVSADPPGLTSRPTVSLDVISLVASCCGYDRNYIEPRAAQELAVYVATQRGRAQRVQHRHPPCAQPVAPMRERHCRCPGLPPRRGTDQIPYCQQGYPVTAQGRRNNLSSSHSL